MATSGSCGTNLTWTLNGTSLVITGSGGMSNYSTTNAAPWGTSITKVSFPDGLTTIGNNAFQRCMGLASISLPGSLTTIGQYAFQGCRNLVSATLPKGITKIGYHAFNYCTSLTRISLPSTLKSIEGSAFYSCTGLTSVTFPNSLANLTTIGGGGIFTQKFYDTDGTTVLTFNVANKSAFEGATFEGVAGENKLVKVLPTVTVAFSTNGNGTVSPAKITGVPYGTAITVDGNKLTINGTTVTATPGAHYHFGSWSKTSGTITADTTITANFAIDTCNVRFYVSPNGGTSDKPVVTVDYGTTFTASGDVMTFSDGQTVTAIPLSGYLFSHWSTSSGTVTRTTGITMYFTKQTYTHTAYLYYNANGGSGAPSTQSASTTTESSTPSGSRTFTISSTTPSKSGYDFLGWSTSSSATSASYQPGSTISVSYGSSKTLYAVWEVSKQYYYARLYYDANGGSGAPSTQSDSIYASSASGSKTFTISSTKPTRSGYDFLGWSTSSTAASASYSAGSTISVSYGSSKRLYAVWEKVPTYTVSFVTSGSGTVNPTSVSGVPKGTVVTASGNVLTINGTTVTATPAKGYRFDYWVGVTSGSTKIISDTVFTARFILDYVSPPFRVRTGDGWRYAAVSVKVDGTYRSAEAYVKVDGAWVKKES